MNYRERDQVPDLDLVQSPERRDLDYTDIQGGNRIGLGGHAGVSRVTVRDHTGREGTSTSRNCLKEYLSISRRGRDLGSA